MRENTEKGNLGKTSASLRLSTAVCQAANSSKTVNGSDSGGFAKIGFQEIVCGLPLRIVRTYCITHPSH
jgi:hypothetical protein